MLLLAIFIAVFGILCNFNVVESKCCDFESGTCAVTPGNWKDTQTQGYPLTGSYPGFNHAPNYVWLQDESDVYELLGFDVTEENMLIDFSYYYNAASANTGRYFHIYFVPDGGSSVLLYSTIIPVDNWISTTISCNADTNYCCGSRLSVPCHGNIQLIGSLGTPSVSGLFGFDDLCVGGSSTDYCCNFMSSVPCDFINDPSNGVYNWYWNAYAPAYPIVPSPSGSFYYFQLNTVTLGIPVESGFITGLLTIPQSYYIDFQYYVDLDLTTTSKSGLGIYFVESTTGYKTQLGFFQTPLATWTVGHVDCGVATNDCCVGQGSCSGRFEIIGHAEPGEGIVTTAVSYFKESGTTC